MIHQRNKSFDVNGERDRLSQLNANSKNESLMSNYKSRLIRKKLEGRANALKTLKHEQNKSKAIENFKSFSN
jgi:hypothetical protein